MSSLTLTNNILLNNNKYYYNNIDIKNKNNNNNKNNNSLDYTERKNKNKVSFDEKSKLKNVFDFGDYLTPSSPSTEFFVDFDFQFNPKQTKINETDDKIEKNEENENKFSNNTPNDNSNKEDLKVNTGLKKFDNSDEYLKKEKKSLEQEDILKKTFLKTDFVLSKSLPAPKSPLLSRPLNELCRISSKSLKKVWFADDVGKQLVHIKIFSDNNQENNINKSNELKLNRSQKLIGSLTLFDICPNFSLVNKVDESKAPKNQTELKVTPRYVSNFNQPGADYLTFMRKVEEKFICLESLRLSDENTQHKMILKGKVLVKNKFQKKNVFMRITADNWLSYKNLPANYVSAFVTCPCDSYVFSFDLKSLLKKLESSEENKQFPQPTQPSPASPSTTEAQLPTSIECAFYFIDLQGNQHWDNNDSANYKFYLTN